jgi:hypothetical protein
MATLGLLLLAVLLVDLGWSLAAPLRQNDPRGYFEMPATARLVIACALIAAVAGLLWRAYRSFTQPPLSTIEYAGLLDRTTGRDDRLFTIAAQLHESTSSSTDNLHARLTSRMLERADAAAHDIPPDACIDRTPLRSAIRFTITVTILWATALAADTLVPGPSRLTRSALRLVDPLGDHPSNAWVQLDLAAVPSVTAIGDDVEVHVESSPGVQGDTSLHVMTEDGDMHRLDRPSIADRGQVAFNLKHLREPITCYATAAHSRSRYLTITPEPRPRVELAEVTFTQQSIDETPLPAVQLADGRYVVPIDSQINVRLGTNRPDAFIDHPAAKGLALTTALDEPPERSTSQNPTPTLHLSLPLDTSSGIRSRATFELEIVGLRQDDWETLHASGRIPAASRASQAATADQAATSQGTAKGMADTSTGAAGASKGPGLSSRSAAESLAMGTTELAEPRTAPPDSSRPPVIADDIPSRYRELVEAYFERVAHDARKPSGPDDEAGTP